MRLAIVAASTYSLNQNVPQLLQVEAELDVLGQRLAEADAGFFVHIFSAQRGLFEGLEQLLQNAPEPIEQLLFYFCGYALVSDERGPALLLDGERLGTLSLKRLRKLLNQAAPSSFAILDTVTAFDDAMLPSAVVTALASALTGPDSSVHLLASNRPASADVNARSPCTSLLELVLDWQSSGEGLSAQGLYTAMRGEETLYAALPAVHYFAATPAFDVLVPGYVAAPSTHPPSPLALEGNEAAAQADALAQAGQFEQALVAYTAALELLGTGPSEEHARLYVRIGQALRAVGRAPDALAYCEAALGMAPRLGAALRAAAELRAEQGEPEAALSMLERWLELEPDALEAVELCAKLLTTAERWHELASLYEHALSRANEPSVAVELALRLATLCRDYLGNETRARPALERAAALDPEEPRVRLLLAELQSGLSADRHALNHVIAAVRSHPRSAESYRAALRLFDKCEHPDGAWNAACALELLGEADINESLLAGAHRPEGLLPARGRVLEDDWGRKLFCPERHGAADQLFTALGTAAWEVGLETARRKRRLAVLDASTAQDPETSTATLAKTLLWTARLLGSSVPKLHVLPELRANLVVAAAPEPTLVVNRALGSGLELPELAFLWGRHLSFVRPEHRLCSFFPTVQELAALVLASLSLGGVAQLPFKKLEGDAKLFARGLKRHLSKPSLEHLHRAAARFPLRDASTVMLSWTRAVELSASRAGLLACGSLEVAARMTERFPLSSQVSAEEQIGDLMAWSVGSEYRELRERLGVLVRA